MKTSRPVIHGRDHLPGGADPIPTLAPPAGGDWAGSITGLSGLRGYWRLGEGYSPFRDTSGVAPAADMEKITGTVPFAMDEDVTPGLLPPDQDDGAVSFDLPADVGAGVPTDRLEATSSGKFDFDVANPQFSVIARIKPRESGLTFYGGIVGDMTSATGGPDWDAGWILRLRWPTMRLSFARGTSSTSFTQAESTAISPNIEYTVAGTYDGTTIRLYINGTLADSEPDGHTMPSPFDLHIGGYYSTADEWQPFYGVIDEVAIWGRALTDGEIAALHQAAVTPGSEGLVLTSDGHGGTVWAPPTVGVTVGGDPPPSAEPPPGSRPDNPNDALPGLDWIVDQPFTWGGSSFDVPPNKWTTIPFTSPLMERWSNVTGKGTVFTELDWDDPAAAGWINPDTPRVITVPHDMAFLDDAMSWMQICLRLEGPMVAPETSYRALRIFETTHQKTLVSANALRAACCIEHGGINVSRDLDVSWTGGDRPAGVFASGDTGGLDDGNHDTIMFMPNSGYAFYLNGNTWLPGHAAGNPTLTAGMRLIPQVWHDAPITLTFHCDSVAPDLYRPHFVVCQTVQRSWGSPWSDWPTYTP